MNDIKVYLILVKINDVIYLQIYINIIIFAWRLD